MCNEKDELVKVKMVSFNLDDLAFELNDYSRRLQRLKVDCYETGDLANDLTNSAKKLAYHEALSEFSRLRKRLQRLARE